MVKVATTVRGGAASGCGAVFGTRRLAGRGCRCSGPTCRQRLSDGGASIRGLASDEQPVKTQPGFGRTDNDGSFPLPRALSCHLIPQGWLPGESPWVGNLTGHFPQLPSRQTIWLHVPEYVILKK
uniref:Uncharacterized protein n=1 Tax=Oryza rufipogon TaxID=4529 RepID=A0A0E0NH65_ORYRU